MTIEEAIESLSLLRIFDAPDLNEAVKMAVAALQFRADTAPNSPLTLERLREIGEGPVWVCGKDQQSRKSGRWYFLVEFCENGRADGWVSDGRYILVKSIDSVAYLPYKDCGKDWFAYRCRPEGD